MYELPSKDPIYWLDIWSGHIALSTSHGSLVYCDYEGTPIFEKIKSSPSGRNAWMVRCSDGAIYQGGDSAVCKFTGTGDLVWSTSSKGSCLFGVQTSDKVYAATRDGIQCNRKTDGALVQRYGHSSYPSCEASEDDGRVFGGSFSSIDIFSSDGTLQCKLACDGCSLSMQYYNGYLYGVGSFGIKKIDVRPETIATLVSQGSAASFAAGRKIVRGESVQSYVPVTQVASRAATSLGTDEIIVEVISEGSKLRVRPITPGYRITSNVQFPRNLRIEGAKYSVQELIDAGSFYRARGSITRLT